MGASRPSCSSRGASRSSSRCAPSLSSSRSRPLAHCRSSRSQQQSIKQGLAFDSPVNALPHIEHFVATYHIDTASLLEPDLTQYRTFNEFFYRRLKPDARRPASPDDPDVVSSAADCRLTVFETVDAAKEFWIKVRLLSLSLSPLLTLVEPHK